MKQTVQEAVGCTQTLGDGSEDREAAVSFPFGAKHLVNQAVAAYPNEERSWLGMLLVSMTSTQTANHLGQAVDVLDASLLALACPCSRVRCLQMQHP